MVDYSKWKNIEVSDDEDETHPNIDTPSLFKWRHEARLKRMEEFQAEKRANEELLKDILREKNEIKRKIEQKDGSLDELEKKLKEIDIKEKEAQDKRNELLKKEKLEPWNVDTISKESWSKTVINKPKPKEQKELTEEEKQEQYCKFIEENEKDIKAFGMLSKWDDCKRFLVEKPNLCCEDATNYLAIWCLNLEMEGKSDLMTHISKQVISMQYILELAKQLDCDPRSCISTFFTKIQKADKEYIDAFENELQSFRTRIKERAKVKLEEAMREVEEEERQARLGPGGLDPLEVLETLPADLKECFESRDTSKLKDVLAKMDDKDAQYHMKRCVDSGLWVLPANDEAEEAVEATENTDGDKVNVEENKSK